MVRIKILAKTKYEMPLICFFLSKETKHFSFLTKIPLIYVRAIFKGFHLHTIYFLYACFHTCYIHRNLDSSIYKYFLTFISYHLLAPGQIKPIHGGRQVWTHIFYTIAIQKCPGQIHLPEPKSTVHVESPQIKPSLTFCIPWASAESPLR